MLVTRARSSRSRSDAATLSGTEITLESRRVAVTMISSMDEAHPAIQAESCAMEGVAAKIFASEANAMPVARGALPIPFFRPMIILLVFWRCHERHPGNARSEKRRVGKEGVRT